MIPWWIEIGFCLSPKTLEIDSLQANLDQQSCKPEKWQLTMEQHLDMAEVVVAMIFVCLGLLFYMILLMKGWWLSSIRSRTDQVKPAYEHTHTQTCDQCLEMLWEFFLARNLIICHSLQCQRVQNELLAVGLEAFGDRVAQSRWVACAG